MQNSIEGSNPFDYGFNDIVDGDGLEFCVLRSGDGKSTFTNVSFEDGLTAVAFGYGKGKGVGVKSDLPATLADINCKWMIIFEDHNSISALIETLERVKGGLL